MRSVWSCYITEPEDRCATGHPGAVVDYKGWAIVLRPSAIRLRTTRHSGAAAAYTVCATRRRTQDGLEDEKDKADMATLLEIATGRCDGRRRGRGRK